LLSAKLISKISVWESAALISKISDAVLKLIYQTVEAIATGEAGEPPPAACVGVS